MSSTYLGQPLAVFILTISFRTVGQAVSRSNVTAAPFIRIRGTEVAEATAGGPFNVTNIRYTVLCIDGEHRCRVIICGQVTDGCHILGNTAGSSNPAGYNLHYLENNLGMSMIFLTEVSILIVVMRSIWREPRSHCYT